MLRVLGLRAAVNRAFEIGGIAVCGAQPRIKLPRAHQVTEDFFVIPSFNFFMTTSTLPLDVLYNLYYHRPNFITLPDRSCQDNPPRHLRGVHRIGGGRAGGC